MHRLSRPSKSRLVAREQRRLGAIFQRAMLIAVGAGIACSTKSPDPAPVTEEAGIDASTDGTVPDAGKDTAPPDRCVATTYTPTPKDTCGEYYTFPCGLPAGLTVRGDCYFAVNDCNSLCPDIHYNCRAIEGFCSTNNGDAGFPGDLDAGDGGFEPPADGIVVPNEAGAVIIDCSICPGSAGRVPAGLAPTAGSSCASLLGAYFANAARLEAASVTAFRRLREELALHGAPDELLASAHDAERDEVRHTLAMARLARRHGGRYVRPHVADVAPRALAVIAEENAVEGCARETFGALLATYQAEHAHDEEIARVMTAIAADETRHAALSWAIARWSLAKLDPGAQARIAAAWGAAMDDVAGADPTTDAMATVAALPSRTERAELARELRGMWTTLLAA